MWFVPSLDTYLQNLQPVKHKYGRSIIMPSGSGKSYWMKHLQHTTYDGWKAIPKRSFIDSDPLMIYVGAMPPLQGENPTGLTWENDMEEICKRCDKVMVECKKRGLWVMGATWWNPELVDAFVVLPAELNKKYLSGKKEGEKFDDDYYEKEVVGYIRDIIRPEAEKHKVPIFDSIEKCARYIIDMDKRLKL